MEEAKNEVMPEKAVEPGKAAETPKAKMTFAVDRKKAAVGIAAVAAIVLGYFAWTRLQPTFVAARVNGRTITRLEVIRELERQGGSSVLDNLISDRLIENKAEAEHVTISASDIDAEVGKLKTQLTAQGQTLDAYLASQHVTQAFLMDRLRLRLILQRLLADKMTVTDADIDADIKQNAASFPKGTDTSAPAFRDGIRDQLSQQKFSAAAPDYLDALRAAADIQYVHKY